MTATDELRRMLDERGVEWMPCAWEPQTETFYKNKDGVAFIATESLTQDYVLLRTDIPVTPAQAIAATLGTGTCRNIAQSYLDFLCSECGFVHYHSDENDSGNGNEWYYCPNCGRRIEVGE